MRRLFNTLSLKVQILVPVMSSMMLILIGLLYSSGQLSGAFNKVSNSTNDLIVYKTSLNDIVENTYDMRIKAIYSLFAPADLQTFISVLQQKKTDVNNSLDIINQIGGLSGEIKA